VNASLSMVVFANTTVSFILQHFQNCTSWNDAWFWHDGEVKTRNKWKSSCQNKSSFL